MTDVLQRHAYPDGGVASRLELEAARTASMRYSGQNTVAQSFLMLTTVHPLEAARSMAFSSARLVVELTVRVVVLDEEAHGGLVGMLGVVEHFDVPLEFPAAKVA
jgi:hypothetical protein